ncbi:hypothetical protein NQZ68_009960 [Dissostichus eleginoides]|nr:hypothetical protein NQZ68_009960 [Dissostichus eleginoides]
MFRASMSLTHLCPRRVRLGSSMLTPASTLQVAQEPSLVKGGGLQEEEVHQEEVYKDEAVYQGEEVYLQEKEEVSQEEVYQEEVSQEEVYQEEVSQEEVY